MKIFVYSSHLRCIPPFHVQEIPAFIGYIWANASQIVNPKGYQNISSITVESRAGNAGGYMAQKEGLVHVKCREHVAIYTVKGEPIFFQHFDGPIYPTLRLLHKYPYILPMVKVDRGAIRFLLAGAHMMCPGLTSKGGYLPPPEEALPAGVPVAIFAEGKENAVGIGITKLGTEEMRKINKDVGVETVTYLGDDLWAIQML